MRRYQGAVPETPSVVPPPPARQTKTVTTYVVIAIALVALAIVVWQISDVFVVAFGGVVLAITLAALSGFVQRWTRCSERVALFTTIGLLAVIVALCSWMFGSLAASQVTELQQRLPQAVRKVMAWLNQSEPGRMAVDAVKRSSVDSKTLSNVGLAAGALVTGTTNLLLIVFLGIYFALDPATYRDGALRLLPPGRRPQVRAALEDAGEALRQWLLAQAVAMLVVGVLTGVGLALVGVPLAFALGLIAGLLEFVPVAGPILSAIPGLLLAFVSGPETVVWALVVYVVVQQMESNIITPILQRWAVELPPAVGLLAVVACTLLFGVTGVVFATPIAVVVMALVKHLYVEDTLEGSDKSTARGRRAHRSRPASGQKGAAGSSREPAAGIKD